MFGDRFGFILSCLLFVLHSRETACDDDDWLIQVSVPEGIFAYPKEIYRVKKEDFYTEEEFSSGSTSSGYTNSTGKLSNCRVEYFQFTSADNLRSELSPQLFTVISVPKPRTTTTPLPATTAIMTSSSPQLPSTTVPSTSAAITSTMTSPDYSTTTRWKVEESSTAAAATESSDPTTAVESDPLSTRTVESVVTSQPLSSESYSRNKRSAEEEDDDDKDFILAQIHDLDRESRDQYTLSLICDVDNSYGYGPDVRWVSVTVTDTNDHTPRFDPDSLTSIVPTNVTVGTAIMRLRASDPDIGLNGKLEFSYVTGSVRRKLANETEAVGRPNVPILFVLKTGDIIAYEKMLDEMTIYMKVVVKDREGRSNGNRQTATATISVVHQFPPIPPPSPHTGDKSLPWWIIMIIASFSGFFVLVGTVLLVKWLRRKGLINVLNLRLNESNDVLLDNETHENDQI